MEPLAGVMASRPGDYLASEIFAEAPRGSPRTKQSPSSRFATVSAAVRVGERRARMPRPHRPKYPSVGCTSAPQRALARCRIPRPSGPQLVIVLDLWRRIVLDACRVGNRRDGD